MKHTCIVMVLLLSIAASAMSQSIAEQLKVAECSFRLYDGPTEVEVLDQMITMRSIQGNSSELKTFGSAYHIELMYKGNELELSNALVEFLDKDKRPLHAIRTTDVSGYMKVDTLGSRPRPKVHYIAISLEGIPLRLFDQVVSIRITDG